MTSQKNNIDDLVFTAVFSSNDASKKNARILIRKLAKESGATSSSIYPIYKSIGLGKIKHDFTVPAINVRFMTYDTARIIFRMYKTHNLGPIVFEIARSEIEYTAQRPDEYAVVVLAAAIKEDYVGPVFIQGDHYQFSKKKFGIDPKAETEKIKSLVKESTEADFLNIDIDASTLVDLEKPTLAEQQKTNSEVTAELTRYIRSTEPTNVAISIGAEIGHIGGKNSTAEDLVAFMDGYKKIMGGSNLEQIAKISVQTGTSHGGLPDKSGKIIDIKLDFNVIEQTGKAAREKYHLAGVVQHGASTLPSDLFSEFPKHKTLEIHLATGFQNLVYENMPKALRDEMHEWTKKNCITEREEGWSDEQFVYKCRKKAIGPFKEKLWKLSDSEKQPIITALTNQFTFLFEKLNIVNKRSILLKNNA